MPMLALIIYLLLLQNLAMNKNILLTIFSNVLLICSLSASEIISFEISDVPTLKKRSMEDPIIKFWYSEQMESFRKPLAKLISEKYEEKQKELKLPEIDISNLFQGRLKFSLSNLDVSVDNKKVKSFNAYLLIETGSKSKESQSIVDLMLKNIDKKIKETPKIKRKDFSIKGTLFHSYNFDSEITDSLFCFAQMKNYLYFSLATKADLQKNINQLLPTLNKPSAQLSDIDFNFNILPLNKIFAQLLDSTSKDLKAKMSSGKGPAGPLGMAGMLDWNKIVSALGFLDLKHISYDCKFLPKGTINNIQLDLIQEPRGFMKMFIPTMGSQIEPFPKWVPENVATYNAQTIPMSQWYNILLDLAKSELPMFAPMILGQLESLKTSIGLDIQSDLFDLFSDELIQIDLSSKKISLENGNRVILCGVKDSTKFEASLTKILGMIPTYKLNPFDYMGAKMYPLLEKPNKEGILPTLAFYKNYFMFSTTQESTQDVIRLLKNNAKKPLLRSKLVKPFLAETPSQIQSITFSNLTVVIKNLLNMVQSNSETLKGVLKNNPLNIDLSDLPNGDELTTDFGCMYGYSTRTSKSIKSVIKTKYP